MASLRANEAAQLWSEIRQRYDQSRRRIAHVRKWLTHQIKPQIPETFTGPSDMELLLPQAMTIPLHTVQVMGRKRPYLRREPIGEGIAARRKSTQIELWANSCLTEVENQGGPLWLPIVDAALNHGELALLCYPTPAHWEQFPDFMGQDDLPLRRYQRDKDGRDADDEYYTSNSRRTFRLNARQTRKAYEEYAQDFKARRIPITARVVTAEQCLPIFGPGFRLDGLLVLSQYNVDSLHQRGYRWIGPNGHPDAGQGSDTQFVAASAHMALLEYFTPGQVCYYVTSPSTAGGVDTSPIPVIGKDRIWEAAKLDDDGDEQSAEIDLAKEFGITRLPATYLYGAHYAAEMDPDFRGVPFLWPFAYSLAALNNLLTAKGVHAWKYGFGGWFIKYTPGTPQELAMENGRPRQFKLDPMTATYIAGEPVATVHQGTGPDVDEIITLTLGTIQQEAPSPAAFGGPGASSGHERSLIRTHVEEAQAHTFEAGRKGWEFLGEMALECATALARKNGTPVSVYASVRGKSSGMGHSRTAIDLTADLCDDVFDLSAYYRRQKGENLPWAQVLAEWTKAGLIPHRQFLEDGTGDEEPEDTMVELAVEDLIFKTPQGRLQLYEEAAREMGDERMAELLRLQESGQMTPDGVPTAALREPDRAQPLTGMATTNPVESSVGGLMSGALGTRERVRDVAAQQQAPVV